MASTVFYSWQSDLPNNINRGFIEDALHRAIKELKADLALERALRDDIELDKDTQNVPGIPPIVETIFSKISKASAFVPDITFVAKSEGGRPVPNPNVLVEYGWALNVLGHARIIPVMNTAFGQPSGDNLPFDMRHLRRPITYHLTSSGTDKSSVRDRLVEDLKVALSAMIKAGLFTPQPLTGAVKAARELLREWHRASEERFLSLYLHQRNREWPVPINVNHEHFSYLLYQSEPHELNHQEFMNALSQANSVVRRTVNTGWSMFHPFTRNEIKPYVTPEIVAGMDTDVIETNLMVNGQSGLPDFWRLTRTGYATLCRPYREDERPSINSGRIIREPGKWFSPRLAVQEVTQLVAHAQAMAAYFPNINGIEFQCTWSGLNGRQFEDFDPGIHWDRTICRADSRSAMTTATPSELTQEATKVIVKLAAPVLVLFDGFELTEPWVEKLIPTFRKI